ncbi:MAG: hypothetical protein AB1465_02730 [Patescibacteria group bacterium]
MSKEFHTIICYHPLQPDTICALVLLKKFGEKKYPGVSEAKAEFMTELPRGKNVEIFEQKGVLCLDLGGGRFDHHKQARVLERFSASDLVARDLGIQTDPSLEKILTYARRDDLEGKGTISKDTIDRAFGLSALIANLNRHYLGHPEKVLETVAPLLLAHLKEEQKRAFEYPEEYRKKWDEGKIDAFVVEQVGRQIRCILIESDVVGMVGFLRAHPEIKADVVAQRLGSGHINIITRQERHLDLREVAAVIRVEELKAKKFPFDRVNWKGLYNKGKMKEIPEWYYDTAANTIQNGGMLSEITRPTQLTLQDIKRALKIGLDYNFLDPRCPQTHCLFKKCRFYFYNLIRCRKIRQGQGAPLRPEVEATPTAAGKPVWSEKIEKPKKETKEKTKEREKKTTTKKAAKKKAAKKK